MADRFELPELPFPLRASHVDVWRHDEQGAAVVAAAPAHTDFYLNPGGTDSDDAETLLNAATLLGAPPAGDFQFSARVTVDFRSQYDAGVLLLWIDGSPASTRCTRTTPAPTARPGS